MAANSDPPPSVGVPILTYVAARFEDLDKRLDVRFGRFDDKLEDLEDSTVSQHEATREDLVKLTAAVKDLTDGDNRRRGGEHALRELVTIIGVLVAVVLSLSNALG